jgi:hypothetical protein
MESPIESAEDLAKKTRFLQKPKVFKGSNAEGVENVLESPSHFAIPMESNSIHYQIERNCELTQIGGIGGAVHIVEV